MTFADNEFKNTYVILEEIGSGSGGTVYKAYHKRLKKEVALKKIHRNLTDINARMETDILKNLKHSYLPQVIDFLELTDGTYTVMEYINGRSLAEVLKDEKVISQKNAVKWFMQMCQALAVLHSQKKPVIHGDIKPANIMLTESGDICLIDFNIASIYEGDKTIMSGYTPGYAAPEQIAYIRNRKLNSTSNSPVAPGNISNSSLSILSDSFRNTNPNDDSRYDITEAATEVEGDDTAFDTLLSTSLDTAFDNITSSSHTETDTLLDLETIIDSRTDIYNLGATVFHLLTGKKPVTSDRIYMDVTELNPEVTPALAHIVNRCIAPDRKDRYQNISEVLNALTNLYMSDDRYKRLIRKQNISRAVLILSTLFFAGLAAFGYVLMGREKEEKYAEYINSEIRAADNLDETGVDRAYEAATDTDPFKSKAYEIKAEFLYDIHRYEEAENFVVNDAFQYVPDEECGNLYHIAGNCLMAEERYEASSMFLKEAVELIPDNSNIYSDYAVSEAKQGNLDEAVRLLDKAIILGLEEDNIDYAQGEIAYKKGELSDAYNYFLNALTITEDEEIRLRSFVSLIDLKKDEGSETGLKEALRMCREAENVLPKAQYLTIREKKIQILVNLSVMTGNTEYDREAVGDIEKLINDGFDSFNTHTNLVELYHKNAMYDEEKAELENMLSIYGESYGIYKYLAFMEAAKQKDSEVKDYTDFIEYYNKMSSLYKDAKVEDAEVYKLMDMYRQMDENGYFAK